MDRGRACPLVTSSAERLNGHAPVAADRRESELVSLDDVLKLDQRVQLGRQRLGMAAVCLLCARHKRGQCCQDPTLAVSHDIGLRSGQAFEHG